MVEQLEESIEIGASALEKRDIPVGPRPYIQADIARKITFASHQCDIAIINELAVGNDGDEAIHDAILEVEANPAFLTGKTWRIDRLDPGTKSFISDRDISLNGQMLLDLSEAMTGQLTIQLRQGDKIISEERRPIELLARNEWGGVTSMPELLAAFATPNDPAIGKYVLKPASNVLRASGKDGSIDGYKSQSRSRVWEITSAIWSAVASRKLSYAVPPASFEKVGQKIRSPSMIMDEGIATCLDSALLFSSALEQAGLNPVVVLLDEHAFAGVWLQPEEFTSLTVDDVSTIRKRVALKEMVLFETTLALKQPAVSFSKAAREANRQISEENESNFSLLVDIRRARMRRYLPISLNKIDIPDSDSPETGGYVALEEAPILPDFDISGQPSQEKDTPETRLGRWQRRLLDLSLRNRLLNFKTAKGAIKLFCPNPGELEDKLADGTALTFKESPQKADVDQDDEIHLMRTGERLDEAYATEALARNQIIVDLQKSDLESRLVNLYRKARAEIQEGGANTLYVALGFLVWKKDEKDDRKFRAPLILLPVSLTRRSVRAGVKMRLHDDEPRLNSTLLQMLRQDFNLTISGLNEEDLPKDDHGIDVPRIWNLVREAVKDSEGFEVVEDVVLSTFSFAKFLMWKDLTERTDQLKENSVVKHLIDTPKDPYLSEIKFPDPRRLDTDYHPSDFYTPLPADSSQLACVAAASLGKDFVQIGPPGTGKSQTISNMITHLIGEGKTVLFVSEKMAALDVVYRRLAAHGLGPFCLELHSNKTRKLDVLDQLRQSWKQHTGASREDWEVNARKLKEARDELNTYVENMHKSHRNGLTVHYALGIVVRDTQVPIVDLRWTQPEEHSADELDAMREVAHLLDVNAEAMGEIAESPLSIIHTGEWSPSWQRNITGSAMDFVAAAKRTRETLDRVLSTLGISLERLGPSHLQAVSVLNAILREAVGKDLAFSLTSAGRHDLERINEGLELLAEFRKEQEGLSVKYADRAWVALDGDSIASDWVAASDAWWPKSLFAKSGIKKQLRAGGASKKPNPEADAPILSNLRSKGSRLDEINKDLEHIRVWRDYETNIEVASKAQKLGIELRRLTAAIVDKAEDLSGIRTKLHSVLQSGEELLLEDGSIGRAAAEYDNALADFEEKITAFEGLSGSSLRSQFSASDSYLDDVLQAVGDVEQNKSQLNDWCAWRRVRDQASDSGLLKLAEAVESGVVQAGQARTAFEANYCRWWLDAAVDQDDVLKKFSSRTHTDRIKTFRELDEEFAELTSRYVVAKLSSNFPTQDEVTSKSEFGILRRELEKRQRHKPLRQLMTEIPDAITELAPCLLMSPLSVAQYLPADHKKFDVVIFDEASQITVWDAVGAIARGKQVIVAGDPKQLPPTNFFSRSEDDEDGDVDDIGDMESILDEMLGSNVPYINLSWHYRSRHESLIAFSNHRYYGGELITFPSPVTQDTAVKLVRVDGYYERGGARTNRAEAIAIVEEIKRRLSGIPKDEKAESVGVITFNSEQQRLIEDLLDEARRQDKTLEPHFSEDQNEPVFVKNLETVQGDERDICLFSIAYGPDMSGHVTMNFGPLNREGGERRLNVAITRARSELIVFATIHPDQIDLSRTSAIGVRDLKHFLQFAEDGISAIAEAVFGSQGDFDSPFEAAVARLLREKGWQLHTQVGVSSFRIDLGVVHPDYPGRYLCGIECDGATYHRSATARDRDKIRESVLNDLGWQLIRIWSTDFWLNREEAVEKVHRALADLLEKAHKEEKRIEEMRESEASTQNAAALEQAEAHERFSEEDDTAQVGNEASDNLFTREDTDVASGEIVPPNAGRISSEHELHVEQVPYRDVSDGFGLYHRADLKSDFSELIDPVSFYEQSYKKVLQDMVQFVLEIEGPILLEDLVTRIARTHGFQKSGNQIRKCVETAFNWKLHMDNATDGSKFVWPAGTFESREVVPRLPATDPDIRLPKQIAMEELIALAEKCTSDDKVYEMAGLLGIKRVGPGVRERLEEALSFF